MFNLEQAIARWRQRMRAGGFDSPVLDELESHLREEVETQIRSGSDLEQAFEVAMERMGSPEQLRAEFRKAAWGGAARRHRRVGLCLAGIACAYSLFVGACIVFRLGSFADTTSKEQVLSLVATGMTSLLLFSGRFAHRLMPAIPRRGTRISLYVAAAGLLVTCYCLLFQLAMARLEFDMGQLLVALLWGWAPMAALAGAIDGLEQAANRQTGWAPVRSCH